MQTEEDADFDRIIQHGQDETTWSGHGASPNPELQISAKLAGADAKGAGRIFQTMSAEDRLLVKLYYLMVCVCERQGRARRTRSDRKSAAYPIHADLRQQVERLLIEQQAGPARNRASISE